ncbi:MAG: hypothetical protein IPO24_20740 [Bacteroidetes bacterium]|nr:hypothetical protein [Bacteroidota bacterium]
MQGTFPFALMPFKKAVDKAHQLCQTLRMENLEYLDKSYEFVTLADFGTQVIINKALCSISPKQKIISEETSEEFLKVTTPKQRAQIVTKVNQVLNEHLTQEEFVSWLDYGQDNISNKVWVIDPIDGTIEFVKSNQYVIGIGELENSIPVFSFLSSYSPALNRAIHYYTQKGKSYSYDSLKDIETELQVSNRWISNAQPYCNNSDLSKIYKMDFVEDDVFSTLKGYISIATGESDVLISMNFANTSLKVWDHVGGVRLLQNAGGIISDVDGTSLDFSKGNILCNNKGALLSNGKFHDKLISKFSPEI